MAHQLTDLGYETFIYIKEHNETGLKYFGKTIQTDINRYKGSGVRWTNHIKKHGYNCKTTVVFSSRFKEDLEAFCLTFSKTMDIVKSKTWANLILENGLDGALSGEANHNFGGGFSKERRENMSAAKQGSKHPRFGMENTEAHNTAIKKANTGKVMSEETRNRISKSISGDRHQYYNINPWLHSKADHHEWLRLDEVYRWWLSNNGPSGKRGCGARAAKLFFSGNSDGTFVTMLRWIRNNGDPRLNNEWLEFNKHEQ